MKNSLLFLVLIMVLSCKRENVEAADTEMPVITMTSPTNNQVFSAGQTVNIAGTVSDNNKIEELHLEITNTTTGVFLTHEHYAPDAATYNLSRTFITQAATSYKIKIEAHDASDNVAKTEIMISSN
jgi:hypothetical protein